MDVFLLNVERLINWIGERSKCIKYNCVIPRSKFDDNCVSLIKMSNFLI